MKASQKKALITGITGQDGSYLAELLLEKGYHVIGLCRHHRSNFPSYLNPLQGKIDYVFGDLSDHASIYNAIKNVQPDEIYNLASQSYPGNSWNLALETMQTNGLGAHHLFDCVRQLKPHCKVYQASSSEMFGEVTESPQTEHTSFNPMNPYAAAKLYAHNLARIYRKSYNLFISCGILFNHESPRRGIHFITQKITYAAACIKLGKTNSSLLNENGEPIVQNNKVCIGNLVAERDWGFAGDYVEAMWMMLQQNVPDDFIIGTGQIKSIQALCETAFSYVGLNWNDYVISDKRFIRPIETKKTLADPKKAKTILGWSFKKTFSELIAEMIEHHLQQIKLQG